MEENEKNVRVAKEVSRKKTTKTLDEIPNESNLDLRRAIASALLSQSKERKTNSIPYGSFVDTVVVDLLAIDATIDSTKVESELKLLRDEGYVYTPYMGAIGIVAESVEKLLTLAKESSPKSTSVPDARPSEKPSSSPPPIRESLPGNDEAKKGDERPKIDEKTREEIRDVFSEDFASYLAREGAKLIREVRENALALDASRSTEGPNERTIDDQKFLEALDDVQITEELKGKVITEYFYEYSRGDTKITGLSYAGARAIARYMALRGEPIVVDKIEWDSGEDEEGRWVGVLTQGHDATTKETRFAYATQYSAMKLRNGGTKFDTFHRVKALNKSERNLLRKFIPERVVVAMYRAWKDEREGKKPALASGAKTS